MKKGPLNRRVTIHRAGIVRDAYGDEVDGFTPGPTIWANASVGAGQGRAARRERLVSAQTAAEAPMVFRIRWRADLADLGPADRIEYPAGGGRMFDIASVVEIGRREGIEIAGTTKAV